MFDEIDKIVDDKPQSLINAGKSKDRKMYIGDDYKTENSSFYNNNPSNSKVQTSPLRDKKQIQNSNTNFSNFQHVSNTKSPLRKEDQKTNVSNYNNNNNQNHLIGVNFKTKESRKTIEEKKDPSYSQKSPGRIDNKQEKKAINNYEKKSNSNNNISKNSFSNYIDNKNENENLYMNNFNYKNYYSNYANNNNNQSNNNKVVYKENNQFNNNNFGYKENNSNLKRNNSKQNLKRPKNEISKSPAKKDYKTYNNEEEKSFEDNNIGVILRGEEIKKKWQEKKTKNVVKVAHTPDITSRARSISRDPEKFSERLYPSHKVNKKQKSNNKRIHNDTFDSKKYNDSKHLNQGYGNMSKSPSNSLFQNENNNNNDYDMENENNEDRIYRRNKEIDYNNFDHKPKLNKNSLNLAKNLGSSKERLTRKKINKSKSRLDEVNIKLDTIENINNSKTIHQANNHCNKLYEKAQHQLKQKLIMHEKKKKG